MEPCNFTVRQFAMLLPHEMGVPVAAMLALTVVSGPMAARVDDNWAQWRGPDGLGVSPSTSYPDEWAPDKNIAWKTPVAGRGHSSPIVWRDRIFLTTSIEGGKAPDDHKAPIHLGFDLKPGYFHPDSVGADYLYTLKVLAFDAKTGKPLWERTRLRRPDVRRPPPQEHLRLVDDGDRRKVGLRVLRVGRPLRVRLRRQAALEELARRHRQGRLGPGTSPIIFENLLILQCDQEMGDGSFIVALDRKDGSEVWRADADDAPELGDAAPRAHAGSASSWSTSGAEVVIAYDPRTGKELWRANGTESHPIPSAVAGDGLVFLTAGSSGKRAMAIKLGGDGDLTDFAGDRVALQQGHGLRAVADPARDRIST